MGGSVLAAARTVRFSGRDLAGRFGLLVALAVVVVGFSIAEPGLFATTKNFRAMVNSQAIVLLLALIATIVLRAGDFDLSIAATMTLSASVAATLLTHGHSLPLAVLAALGSGVAIGLINGVLVVVVGVDAFIVTLGMLTALGGLAYAALNNNVVTVTNSGLLGMARHTVAGLPLGTIYGWVLALILWFVYEMRPVGRQLLFVGGNRHAAELAGLRVRRLRMGAFLASAVLSSVVGLILVGNLGAMDPSVGPQYLLQPFAAAFLGATAIKPGRFNSLGTVIGVYLLIAGITGVELKGAEEWVTSFFNGVALVVAVTATRIVAQRKRRPNPASAPHG